MIRQQHPENNIRTILFCIYYRSCCNAVKPAIMTDYKLSDIPFLTISYHGFPDDWQNLTACFPVSNKKAPFHRITPSQIL